MTDLYCVYMLPLLVAVHAAHAPPRRLTLNVLNTATSIHIYSITIMLGIKKVAMSRNEALERMLVVVHSHGAL
jgi:hypothetical protein